MPLRIWGAGSGGRFQKVPESSGVCWCRFRRQVPEGSEGFWCVLVRVPEATSGSFWRVPVCAGVGSGDNFWKVPEGSEGFGEFQCFGRFKEFRCGLLPCNIDKSSYVIVLWHCPHGQNRCGTIMRTCSQRWHKATAIGDTTKAYFSNKYFFQLSKSSNFAKKVGPKPKNEKNIGTFEARGWPFSLSSTVKLTWHREAFIFYEANGEIVRNWRFFRVETTISQSKEI